MIAFETFETLKKGEYIAATTIEACEKLYELIKTNEKISHGISYWILAARLMRMSYPNYLRYIRDELGGEIVKNNEIIYTYVIKDKKVCDNLVKELNERWNEWEASL